ncbi:MFS transporter [Actinomadura namibiensis]|uniref:Putative MFS family arabinose efflux permease n=1 Tax=Actinomadura namibiensis TaxID=182080 RepID=A0A7W3QK79_ACTNM|nr:MFS transporter [Actinomadura namibiensis]MBA8950140.1 putative MFS family arabinose efflux permease [Actinomadura namibiensis]
MTAFALPARAAGLWPAVTAAALTATVTVTPGFTVGAFTAPIAADLRVSRLTLGLAMSVFYAATALGSPFAKRLAARLPVPTALTVAALAASATLLAVSLATHAAVLFAALAAGGLTNALVQPAAGRVIAARAPEHRRSLASGLVGAALGAATLIPGMLVAFVLPAHGWRAAMAAAAVIALLPAALAPLTRVPAAAPAAPRPGAPDPANAGAGRTLRLWAVAAALSAAGNNAVATYFVTLAGHAGIAGAVAGNLLSLSALLAIAVRLAAGGLTDRAPRHNPAVIAAMMAAGAAGLALVALGHPAAFLVGAVLAFSAGWGWTGLLLATVIRLLPGRAENAGHTVQVGVFSGAAVAPFAFGALSDAFGADGAALAAAGAGLAAAVLTVLGARTGR